MAIRGYNFTVRQVSAWTGLAASSIYERSHPGHRRVTDPIPQAQQRSDIALTGTERHTIADRLNQDPTHPISQVFYDHLDAGTALASQRSYYRIAATALCPARYTSPRSPARAASPVATAPTLVASSPYETLVWDITFLPGLRRGELYALHCVLDLYSRAIAGWQVATGPDAEVAASMFHRIADAAHAAGYSIAAIHSDNGETMKSTAVIKACAALGARRSYSRPVSDDNPHMESSFSTLKGDANYPKVFTSLGDALTWVQGWVEFYNTRRHHPGLAHFTPHQLLTGTWRDQWAIRHQAKQALFDAHPARYRHQRPVVAQPPQGVAFNIVNTPRGHLRRDNPRRGDREVNPAPLPPTTPMLDLTP